MSFICSHKLWEEFAFPLNLSFADNYVFSGFCIIHHLLECTDSCMALQIGWCDGCNEISDLIIAILIIWTN